MPARPEPDLAHRLSWRGLRAAMRFATSEALAAFRRNGLMSAAAVTTITVALMPVGVAVVLAANLRLMATMLERQVQVVAYLRDRASPEERERITAQVQALPGVRRVEFVGRDQALVRLQNTLGEGISLRDVIDTNPLPDSLEITLGNPREARSVATVVRQIGGVEDVTFGAQAVDRLLAVTGLLRSGGATAGLLLGGVALIIIINTIRLTVISRRQEIEIMQLVGASPWYVRSPFMLEGVLQGLVATALAALVLIPGYIVLLARARAVVPFLPLVHAPDLLPALVASLALGGMLVGTGGSLLALRRFLHP